MKPIQRRSDLSQFSHARIGLQNAGGHLKTQDWLDFQVGFAQAKDAVVSTFDVNIIINWCENQNLNCLSLETQATRLQEFILRPDLGKKLSDQSAEILRKQVTSNDLSIIISGGLSPIAIEHHVIHLLTEFIPVIQKNKLTLAPIMIFQRARVALGDDVNDCLKTKKTIMLIGERPGLTTPDSLGIYITPNAKMGCTDADRFCISNIHGRGMGYADANRKLCSLIF